MNILNIISSDELSLLKIDGKGLVVCFTEDDMIVDEYDFNIGNVTELAGIGKSTYMVDNENNLYRERNDNYELIKQSVFKFKNTIEYYQPYIYCNIVQIIDNNGNYNLIKKFDKYFIKITIPNPSNYRLIDMDAIAQSFIDPHFHPYFCHYIVGLIDSIGEVWICDSILYDTQHHELEFNKLNVPFSTRKIKLIVDENLYGSIILLSDDNSLYIINKTNDNLSLITTDVKDFYIKDKYIIIVHCDNSINIVNYYRKLFIKNKYTKYLYNNNNLISINYLIVLDKHTAPIMVYDNNLLFVVSDDGQFYFVDYFINSKDEFIIIKIRQLLYNDSPVIVSTIPKPINVKNARY